MCFTSIYSYKPPINKLKLISGHTHIINKNKNASIWDFKSWIKTHIWKIAKNVINKLIITIIAKPP